MSFFYFITLLSGKIFYRQSMSINLLEIMDITPGYIL